MKYERRKLGTNKYSQRLIEETFSDLTVVQILGSVSGRYFGLLCNDGTIIRGCYLGIMVLDAPVPSIKIPLNVPVIITFEKDLFGVGQRTLKSVKVIQEHSD